MTSVALTVGLLSLGVITTFACLDMMRQQRELSVVWFAVLTSLCVAGVYYFHMVTIGVIK